MTKKVLVFAPHPDDELFGCGGSMIKHIRSGSEVTVVYVTSGSFSIEASTREREAKASCAFLGIKRFRFLKEEDRFLLYGEKLFRKILNILTAEKPDWVYVPHDKEDDHDHRIVFEVVSEALKMLPESKNATPSPERVLCYEVWTPLDSFNYVEDITDTIVQKRSALRKNVSQIASFKLDEASLSLNRYRGLMTGVGEYCEVFEVIRC